MIVFPVLIPGQNFLFPETGREITKCHRKGNLMLVFPGVTGNGNSRSPLSPSSPSSSSLAYCWPSWVRWRKLTPQPQFHPNQTPSPPKLAPIPKLNKIKMKNEKMKSTLPYNLYFSRCVQGRVRSAATCSVSSSCISATHSASDLLHLSDLYLCQICICIYVFICICICICMSTTHSASDLLHLSNLYLYLCLYLNVHLYLYLYLYLCLYLYVRYSFNIRSLLLNVDNIILSFYTTDVPLSECRIRSGWIWEWLKSLSGKSDRKITTPPKSNPSEQITSKTSHI